MVVYSWKERPSYSSTNFFCLIRAQSKSIKYESSINSIASFEHKKECWNNKLDFTSPNYLLNLVCIGFVDFRSLLF